MAAEQRPVQGLERGTKLFVTTKGHKEELAKRLLDKVEAIGLKRSIALGSTMTIAVRDPDRELLKAGFLTKDNQSDIEFDELWFRAVHLEKSVDEYTLEFEDREISLARAYKGPYKQSAAQRVNPRALFIQRVLHNAAPHAKFFCSDFHKQLVLPAKESAAAKKAARKKGAAARSLKIGGKPADPDQRANIETVNEVCDRKSASKNVRIAIFEAALVEGVFRTHAPANDGTGSDGVFQLTNATAGENHVSKFDTKACAELWLDKGFFTGPHGGGGGIKLGSKGLQPGVIAQEVEGSKFPTRYEEHRKEAEELIANAGGAGEGATSGATEAQYTPQRFFSLPANEKPEGEEAEGAWECATAYAEEVNWRLFCSAGVYNFVSDPYLEKQKPAMEIDDGSPGVIDIKWALDKREKKNPPTLTVEGRAALWFAPPGSAVIVGKKQGKDFHEGVWLVSEIDRKDITDNAVTITLERPKDPLAERALSPVSRPKKEAVTATAPQPPEGNTTRDGGHNAGVAAPTGTKPGEVYFNAKYIASLKLPYVYGGGHGSSFGPTPHEGFEGALHEQKLNHPSGLDCSSAVSWALGGGKAALVNKPLTTRELEHWGIGGEGFYFTVWVINTSSHEHTFLEFHFPGKPKEIFVAHGTGISVRSGGGVGFDSESHNEPGWKARHWPGC